MAFPLIPVAVALGVGLTAGGGGGFAGGVAYADGIEKTGEALEKATEPAKHASNAIMSLSACVAICALCYAGLKISGKG